MSTVLLRTLIIYIILELSMKLMGKRQLGEFQLSELVTTLLISELAALPICDPNIPLLYVICPLAVIITLEVATSFASVKSDFLRRIFTGKPSIIICRGVLDQKEMCRQRISCSELLGQLRQSGITDIADVDYAIIEDNGMLSVFPKPAKRPPNADEFASTVVGQTSGGIAHSLVIDGVIIESNMLASGKSREFIDSELSRRGCRLSDVMLLTYSDAGDVNLIRKERKR